MQDKDIEAQLEIFKGYLRNKGLRVTRQRLLIVETFLESEGHLSADELYALIRRNEERIGSATVFRTLRALTECGLARKTDLGDGVNRFEPVYKRPRHHHIQCLECRRTIEFFSPELEHLQERIVAQYNFQPVRNRFQIFGFCQDCRNRKLGRKRTYDSDLVFTRDALKIAMETEIRGVNFYSAASEVVESETTRATFLEMLRDEEKHLRGLKEEWSRLVENHADVLEAPVFLHFDYEALKRIFPSRDEVQRKLSTDMSEEEALRMAMQMEKEAFDFFSEYADKFNDTRGRDIFLRFAEEERDHYNLIKAAYERLQ